MKNKELVDEFAREARLPKKTAARLLSSLVTVMQRNLIAGHAVQVKNLGRLQRGVTAPRKLNGKKSKPANVIYFRAARSLLNRMREV